MLILEFIDFSRIGIKIQGSRFDSGPMVVLARANSSCNARTCVTFAPRSETQSSRRTFLLEDVQEDCNDLRIVLGTRAVANLLHGGFQA
jgi:hypothetical protein